MPSCRFTSRQRILTPKEYRYVFDNTVKKIHTEHFLLVVACPLKKSKITDTFFETGFEKTARLGLAVTKKKLKKAVDRNYIKRIARESFRQIYPAVLPVDCVLLIKKPPFTKASKSSTIKDFGLYDEIVTLFTKLKNSSV